MLQKIIDVVKDASKLMDRENLQVHVKTVISDFVTSADVAVQEYLQKHLLEVLPGAGFVGEENDTVDVDNEYTFIVDPIDGTSNFVRDLGLSCISVGLLHYGKPYIGVIYNPYRDEVFYAQKGQGCYVNGRRVTVSDRDFAHSHLCSAMCLYNKGLAKPCFNIIERVYEECDDLRRLGTAAIELASLAAGRVELYFEMRLFPWDVAAAAIMIEEAGGFWECLHLEGLPYSKPFGFIAANTRENFEKLRDIVYKEIPQKMV